MKNKSGNMKEDHLIKIRNLKKYYPIRVGLSKNFYVKAVDGVSFNITKDSTFGLVGESGCGKTTTGKLILGLIRPTDGSIYYMDKDLITISKNERKKLGKELQMVFQNPTESINPRKNVEEVISLPLKVHTSLTREEIHDQVCNILNKLGLNPPELFLNKYPHELSGGQKQRLAIARSIILNPKFIVADEPTSALDVSVRGKILDILLKIKKEFQLTYLYITHDLSVCRSICDTMAVMYLGKIVEMSPVDEFFNNPLHPYTKALLSAVPKPDPDKTQNKKRIILDSDVPSPINLPSGCRFHTRCVSCQNICTKKEPELVEISKDHFVRCTELI
jgi:oligopeptide/dipeptide ABC transporter ATP-binding protein